MKELFTETYKAILAAKAIEDRTFSEIPLEEDLKLVEEELKKAKTPEEYDFLKERKDQLEKDIRFKPQYLELAPEKLNLIKDNYDKELEIAKAEHQKRMNQIEKTLNQAVKEIAPLLEEVKQINKAMANAAMVKPVLKGEIKNRPTYDQEYLPFARNLSLFPTNNIFSNNIIGEAEKMLNESITAILNPHHYNYSGNTIKNFRK